MDLPPLTNNAISKAAASKANASAGNSLLDISKLAAGSQLSAQVESVAPISAKLRAQLLAFYTQTTGSPSQTAAQGASKGFVDSANSAPIPAQAQNPGLSTKNSLVALLSKPELFAVQLSAFGKRVLTFSEFPLPLKQRVPVFIRGDGQLQINAAALKNTPSTQSLKQTQTANAQFNSGLLEKNQSLNILNEGLRRYLPLQSKLSDAFAQLQAVNKQLSLVSKSQAGSGKNVAVSQNANHRAADAVVKTLTSQIDALLAKAPSLQSRISPEALKSAIFNSGALLESKLRADNNFVATLQSAPAQTGAGIATNSGQALHDDVKAELLAIINSLAKLLPSANASVAAQSSAGGALEKILQSLFSSSARASTDTARHGTLSKQALAASQRTLPALVAALARISGLQIQHLTQQDGLGQNSGTFLELPVKIGEHFYPLSLQIQEKIVEQRHGEDGNKKDKEKNLQKRKKWQVFMEFDLDEHGTFASEINCEENRVNTRLWVQKESLWSASKNHLAHLQSELEEAGIVVEHLSCQQGSAPEKRTQLRQSLVDIRT